MKCTACGQPTASNTAAKCSACPCVYHKECISLPITASVSKEWACPQCKKKVVKGDNTPVRNVCGHDNVSTAAQRQRRHEARTATVAAAAAVGTGTPATASPVTTDAAFPATSPHAAAPQCSPKSDMQEWRHELSLCVAEFREFRREMAELRATLTVMNARMDGLEHRLEAVEQLRASEPPASVEVAELNRTVARLKDDLNERDQEALLSDIEIGHLPEDKGENVLHSVTVLAAKLGVALEERDIVFAERVGVAQGAAMAGTKLRERRVVVRLARRDLRDQLLQAARVRRSLGATDAGLAAPQHRIFLNERLTRVNRQLFHRAREECRRLQWRYTWTKRGRVYARQGDGKPVHSIRSSADIGRVFGTDSV